MLFSAIPGQHEVKEKLVQLVTNNRLSHALLFLGKEGSGSLQLASALDIGAAALIEDASVKSKSSLTSNLRLSRKMSEDMDVTLDVLNLTDRKNNDISYYYSSRLPGEPLAGVSDVHVHPSAPRTWRLTTRVRF